MGRIICVRQTYAKRTGQFQAFLALWGIEGWCVDTAARKVRMGKGVVGKLTCNIRQMARKTLSFVGRVRDTCAQGDQEGGACVCGVLVYAVDDEHHGRLRTGFREFLHRDDDQHHELLLHRRVDTRLVGSLQRLNDELA